MPQYALASVGHGAGSMKSTVIAVRGCMRVVNESIARMANAEDGVTGRFWEGRFKSQALLDEVSTPRKRGRPAAVKSAPVEVTNAGAEKPEKPTSENREKLQKESRLAQLPLAPLMAFDATGEMEAAIPFAFADYLELVEATGRVIWEGKRGFIDGETPKLLGRLQIDPEHFIVTSTQMMREFSTAIGTPARIQEYCVNRQQAYLRGISAARVLYPQAASGVGDPLGSAGFGGPAGGP